MFVNRDIMKFKVNDVTLTMYEFRLQKIDIVKPVHYHSEHSYEIHYVSKGSGKLILDDEVYDISEGSIFLTGPFVKHGQIPNTGDVLIKYSIYLEVEASKDKQIYNKWVGVDNFEIKSILDKIINEYEKHDTEYIYAIQNYLALLLILIQRSMLEKNGEEIHVTNDLNNKLFEIEKIFLEEFKTITLAELSKRLYIGERQLQRFLLKNYKKTFNELKLEARMLYAANKLEFSSISIAELSEETGYSTAEHFSYAFKQFFGVSPLKYKKDHLFIEMAKKKQQN